MEIGMLWRDDDKNRTLQEKVERAAEYYADKYGNTPNYCMVHASQIEEATVVGTLKIVPGSHIRPQHLWIGIAQH